MSERLGKRLPPLKPQVPKQRQRRASAPSVLPISGQTSKNSSSSSFSSSSSSRSKSEGTTASWRRSLIESPVSTQIPRKRWNFLKNIFDEHSDGSGFITESAFVEAVVRADKKKAEDHAKHVKSRFHDQNVGSTIGNMAEKAYLDSPTYARRQHATAMFYSFIDKKAKNMTATWKKRDDLTEGTKISLLDFMCLNIPHLPRDAVRRACEFYAEKPPPPPKEEKLSDVEGAKEEIAEMFKALDKDRDGILKVKNLEPVLIQLGITKNDMDAWLGELPPSLHRVKGASRLDISGRLPQLTKQKSKLDIFDLERLMEPVYVSRNGNIKPELAKEDSLEDIQKRIAWNEKIANDVIYGIVA